MDRFCILQEGTQANKIESHSQNHVCGGWYSVWGSEQSDQVKSNLEHGKDLGDGASGNVKCLRIKNK